MAQRRTARGLLSRGEIVDAALAFAEEAGLQALSLHKVADRVGVRTMSLYRYVRDKDDLLDAMGDAVLTAMTVPEVESMTWEEALAALADAFRAAVRAHPHAAPLLLTRRINAPASLPMVETTLKVLTSQGLSAKEAVHVLRVYIAFLIGTLLREVGTAPTYASDSSALSAGSPDALADSGFPLVADAATELSVCDHEAEMKFGLAMFTAALRERLGAS
ncbi:TetR/AcrR family transcriptional regulator [Streptomyces sp. NBC_01594]|uniref:TetR/AcrR family transcriptional regulator n=1 Tax=Streptomyces sp. NBC_01594 TaxID=2975890 RepID=UPI0038686822